MYVCVLGGGGGSGEVWYYSLFALMYIYIHVYDSMVQTSAYKLGMGAEYGTMCIADALAF